MRAISQSNQERQLLTNITEIASILRNEGMDFNQHLIRQFTGWNRVRMEELSNASTFPPEHLLFLKAIAQILTWLQQLPVSDQGEKEGETGGSGTVPIAYLRLLLEAKAEQVHNIAARLEQLLQEGQRETRVRKPRRFLAVLAGLETWSRVELPDVGPSRVLNLEEVQRLALSACGRARWTALAPLKMYAIYKLSEGVYLPTPREIFPPMGSAVSRGIERLFGFALGESENDYSISRALHWKLADLAQTTIWDINSGFYKLGGGV
jgi:hypothetical protein